MNEHSKILIIGRPGTSKTTYLAQLFNRIDNYKSVFTFAQTAENISSISDARTRLALGEPTETTPANSNSILELHLKYKDNAIDIYCPDYGGEQVNTIISSRTVGPEWATKSKESNSWIIFIRPSLSSFSSDLSNKDKNHSINSPDNTSKEKIDNNELSEQTFWVELLQILLFVKEKSLLEKQDTPKILVVLSCWDELNSSFTPENYFTTHFPLLHSFLKSNFQSGQLKVFGLSAQGFDLHKEENKERYRNDGPESFGFLLYPDGKSEEDISKLFAEAI